MRRSSRLILLLGVFLAVGAFVLILYLGGGGRPSATPTPAIARLVVAVVDIPQGTTITESMLRVDEVALVDAPGDSFSLPERVVGKTARQSITAGAYVPEAAITGIGGGATIDVSRELKPGEHAIAVQMADPNAGVAFLIQSGDRIDVIVTLSNLPIGFTFNLEGGGRIAPDVPNPNGAPPPQGPSGGTGFQLIGPDKINRTTAKVLIQNVRVVYARSEVIVPSQSQGTPPPGSETTVSQTLVLALTAQQAELWSFIQTLTIPASATDPVAKFFLALRSPEDAQATADITSGIVLRTLLDDYNVLPPRLIVVENQGR